MNRALVTRLGVAASSLLLSLVLLAAPAPVEASAGRVPPAPTAPAAMVRTAVDTTVDMTVAMTVGMTVDDDDTTRPTLNEFLPEQRPLSDCLSSLPKPDCGSKARGGWAQSVVFSAIVAALAFITWRIVAASRRARRERDGSVTPGTRDATTVPDGGGGDPAP